MITLRVLSTAAAMALLLPMAAPTASFAENPKAAGGAGVRVGGGGGGPPVARFNGGGGGAPVARMSGGGAPVARFNAGGGAPVARFNGGGGGAPVGVAPVARFNGGGGGAPVARMSSGSAPQARFSDGRREWRDGDRRRGGGFGPGFAAGAIIGGAAIASQSYGYYGGPGYYAPGYYDDQYYDTGTVAVAAPGGDDAVAYCMQTYQSYDPASGTYLGYDGFRHPCP